jgi:hypothetical protein
MKRSKFFSNRKAVSPVLSSLLLTVVAVAAMSLATTATYVITTNLRENMSERLIVEDLWFNNAGQEVGIYLSNVGKVGLHILSVYINHIGRTRLAQHWFPMDKW